MKDKVICGLVSIVILFLLSGCMDINIKPQRMRPEFGYSEIHQSTKRLFLAKVSEGEVRTDPLTFVSKIDGESYYTTLQNVIRETGLFKLATTRDDSDYELTASIISQEVLPGFTATGNLYVRYQLVDAKTRKTVWEENIFSTYDAEMEEFDGGERQRRANEGAVRSNIRELVYALSDIVAKL